MNGSKPTKTGVVITASAPRIEFAVEQLRKSTATATAALIMARWGVAERSAWRDIAAAHRLIAHDLDASEARAGELRRCERIADKAEHLALIAADAADHLGAATLQKAAIAASKEISRLTGAYTPVKVAVDITESGTDDWASSTDEAWAALDDHGRDCAREVLRQLEAARADGRLRPREEATDEALVVDGPVN